MKATLIVMAAGMGSRYGGLKQIEPVGPNGEIIINYTVYDAIQAGFNKIIFVIRKEHEKIFDEEVKSKLLSNIEICYAYQDLSDVPDNIEINNDRTKPLGTAHAVWSARDLVDGPFVVVNADDYYGRQGFIDIYNHFLYIDSLTLSQEEKDKLMYCMVGYKLKNTLTENGSVSRGICNVIDGHLLSVTERTKVYKSNENALAILEDNSELFLSGDSVTSMNLWGFPKSFMDDIEYYFSDFYINKLSNDPLKAEYYIPTVVTALLNEKKATVRVLLSDDKWYGVTYKEDKETVKKGLLELIENGVYPENITKTSR